MKKAAANPRMFLRKKGEAVVLANQVHAVKASELASLTEVFTQMRANLHRYFLCKTANAALADDLLQDVFVKVLEAIKSDRPPANMSAWLYRVAHTTVVDYFRTQPQRFQVLDEDMVDENAAQGASEQELAESLNMCLQGLLPHLEPIYRDTVLALDFQQQTLQAVADAQGVSLSAVKSRATRGRKLLKEKFLHCCDVAMEDGKVVEQYCKTPSCGCSNKAPA